MQLDQECKSSSRPEPSHSTPSSPKQPRIIRPSSTPPQKSMPPPLMTILKPPKKGPPPLPLDSPPIKPSPPATAAASSLSPSVTPKKRQRSSSIDSSGDEVPKHQCKKDKPRHHSGSNICWVDEGALDRLYKVQPQLLKDLRVLHNFKKVNGQDLEDPKNFPNARITTVICKGRGLEGVMKMLGDETEAPDLISYFKDDLHSCKGLAKRVPVMLHPSLYRAVKLTYPQDIGGLAHDRVITNEMATGLMSQTVGNLTPAMFSLGTQPL